MNIIEKKLTAQMNGRVLVSLAFDLKDINAI